MTPTDPIDFRAFAAELNARAESLLFQWLPNGKLIGREYMCGSIANEPGDSFRFNIDKCIGKDFATGVGVSDMLDLYCKIHDLRPIDAVRELSGKTDHLPAKQKSETPPEQEIGVPPKNHTFTGAHYQHGKPALTYTYTDENGAVLFYVCRYHTEKGKQFAPWSWSKTKNKFVAKAYPHVRPLWNLAELHSRPDSRVILVEGEKSAVAASVFVPSIYTIVTWSGGANAWSKTDFTPLHNRHVILWPDADDAGRKCMAEIAGRIVSHTLSLKILNTDDLPRGFDAADLPEDTNFYAWARPRAREIILPEVEPETPPTPTVINQNLTVNVTEEPEAEPTRNHYALWNEAGIELRGKQKTPDCNVTTVLKIFHYDKFFRDNLWWDTFLKAKYTPAGRFTEADEINILVMLQEKYGLAKLNKTTVQDAITSFVNENTRNHLTEWLDSLKFDGTFRVDEFLTRAMGVEKTPYTQAVSRNFWLSLVARAYKPGCKVDEMMILEGEQGTFKSTALEIIGGKYYGKVTSMLDSKDFMQSLQGRWLMEMDELDKFSRAADTTVKQILSTSVDLFRASYGRETQEYPRTCIFVGTTNESNYLRDATGARRFWPIKVNVCDTKYIQDNRENLLAEAVMRFKAGERWHEVPIDEAQAERADRAVTDEWEPIVHEYVRGREFVMVKDLCTDALHIQIKDIGTLVTNRVTYILKRMGWEARRAWVDGERTRAWVPKDSAQKHYKTPSRPSQNLFPQH